MWLSQSIQFPNLGITAEPVPKSFLLFGDVRISLYGLILGAAIIIGFLITRWQAGRTGQDKELYLDFSIYAIIFSLIGARLFYVAFSWEDFREEPLRILDMQNGGMAVYGAILAGILTAFIYCRIKRMSFWKLADTVCLGLAAGQAIGRWGNFFNREAFGGYTDNLFAMRLSAWEVIPSSITEEMLLYAEQDGYPGYIQVHPTFLYESLWCFALLVILIICTRFKKFEGQLFLIYLIGYAAGRLWIEGLRTDRLYVWGTELPVSQVLSLAVILLALLLLTVRWIWSGRTKRSIKGK